MLAKLTLELKSQRIRSGIIPTYLSYQAEDYDVLNCHHPINGLPIVDVKKWRVMLPHFLSLRSLT